MNRDAANRSLLAKLALTAVGGFAFAFALVPLYRIACESLFGIKLKDEAVAAERATFAPDTSRTVRVSFDAAVADGLAWGFAPKQASIEVHPGVPVDVVFYASNRAPLPVVGQAVPSVAPAVASGYFHKTECFCFTEQKLEAGQTREMPVRFVVDPALPADVKALTLSYTFYLNEAATRRVAAEPRAAPAVPAT